MSRKINHRLVPLETLYPSREKKEQPVKPKLFVRPGKNAVIPREPKTLHTIRYIQALHIRNALASLEEPLHDIEDDTTFIANAMNAALQVPGAIETTFNRIHGKIYDIQREIDHSNNTFEDSALKIQNSFKAFRETKHYNIIKNALSRTIKRDCAPMHQALLGFIVGYEKKDDHLRFLMNRRFLIRNRHALRYWREWAQKSKTAEQERIGKIPGMHETWLKRKVSEFLKKWRTLSFSKHSRKSVKLLHARINAEVHDRLASQAQNVTEAEFKELFAKEREKVIIEYGKRNYIDHVKKLFFRLWKHYIEHCKKQSKTGDALARRFWITRKKKTFIEAWFSLSIGRINVFGGYLRWRHPINRRKVEYENKIRTLKHCFREWRIIITRKNNLKTFSNQRQTRCLRNCLLAYHGIVAKKKAKMLGVIDIYKKIVHGRMHKIFKNWYHIVVKERVRKLPLQFIQNRSILMRKYGMMRKYFRKWFVKWTKNTTERYEVELTEVNTFVQQWDLAAKEMNESMVLINDLSQKLTDELTKRKEDLAGAKKMASFMKNEQQSLAYAMRNAKLEIERLQELVGKSPMRYFIDIRPVHAHVVEDIPGALEAYIQQKEEERKRLLEETAAQQEYINQQQRITSHGKRKRSQTPSSTGRLHIKGSKSKKKLFDPSSTPNLLGK